MKTFLTLLLLPVYFGAFAQKLDTLTVEKIMRDPKWIGISPSNIHWSEDSKKIYFNWNPANTPRDELYAVTPSNTKPIKVSINEQRLLTPQSGQWNKTHTLKVYAKNGDIFLEEAKTGKIQQLTITKDIEKNPVFSGDGSKIIFMRGYNLYSLKLTGAELVQLTYLENKITFKISGGNTEQDKWLKNQQLELFDIIKKEKEDKQLDSAAKSDFAVKKPKERNLFGKTVEDMELSPDGRYVTYQTRSHLKNAKETIVPDYVTASGYTEDIHNRTKVGAPQDLLRAVIYDTKKDSDYRLKISDLPGIYDPPAYLKDYPKELERVTKAHQERKVSVNAPSWSVDGKNAVVEIFAQDNKDRWIAKLDPANGDLTVLDREHNDAWIGGPGAGNSGWVDNTHYYYESEASGYAHIYLVDVTNGTKKQLTSGDWEVQTLQLSNDKKTFYFTANMTEPGATDFYRIPVAGGKPVKLTAIKGMNDVTLSPDEKWLAIRYSYTNKPWELYIQPNKPGAMPTKVTNSTTEEFNAYPWRDPQLITFKNRYGSDVYAHIYLPKHADPAKPAVVFVHGAGYLQNVNYGWGYYFREFMFNNMLADNGYTVLDMDYSGSAGYGREWRTAIYRHMGGKDLTDQVDGVKLLVDKYGVNPKHVGIYGGSYGGFITLMAMFTEPDVFSAGAAIRSVTDWAHYNHEYTDAILNEPFTDEKAYRQSSPIYFANGLKGNLLMLHGMIDQNVNYQDIIRLTQKLIELHKDNWELASYPVEDHAFEQPSSWTDEYKRILKLFEQTLKKP